MSFFLLPVVLLFLYNYLLFQKPAYNLIVFKKMLSVAIGFIHVLQIMFMSTWFCHKSVLFMHDTVVFPCLEIDFNISRQLVHTLYQSFICIVLVVCQAVP